VPRRLRACSGVLRNRTLKDLLIILNLLSGLFNFSSIESSFRVTSANVKVLLVCRLEFEVVFFKGVSDIIGLDIMIHARAITEETKLKTALFD
jgi:hypothetical protein